MTLTCEYCKKLFSNKYVLKNHQKTTKYCLKLQNKKSEENYICNNCNSTFSLKAHLKTHMKTCKVTNSIKELKISYEDKIKTITEEYESKLKDKEEKIKTIIAEYKKELDRQEDKYEIKLDDLQNRIQELATKAIYKPTQVVKTTTNNTTNNVLNLTPIDLEKEDFKAKIEESYDMNYFLKGVRGMAEFTKDKLLTDEEGKCRYKCVDTSRQIFKYVDENGETRKDIKANRLTNKVAPDIVNKANRMVGEEMNKEENYKETIDVLTDTYFNIKNVRDNPDKLGVELVKIICD